MMNKILHRISSARREQVLLDFAEQRLSPRQQARVARHLAHCVQCQEQINDQQAYLTIHRQHMPFRYGESADQTATQPLPPELSSRLHQQIQAMAWDNPNHQAAADRHLPVRPNGWLLYNRSVVAAAALLVLLAVAGLLNLKSGRASQTVIPELEQAMDSALVQENGIASAKMDNLSEPVQNPEEQPAYSGTEAAALPEAPDATEAAAGLMMVAEAAPASWSDALAMNMPLPIELADQPDSSVMADELAGEGVQAAVWLNGGHLLLAYPEEQAAAAKNRLEKYLINSQPATQITMYTASSLAEWITGQVPADDQQAILEHLGMDGTSIIIITIGGF